jgi:hypothetical protein
MTPADATARETLRQLITGFRLTHLVAAAAELGLADHFVDSPRTSAEVAPLVGAHADALHRVMRALAALGVFTMHGDGRFSLAPMGEYLRSDTPGSLRPLARFWDLDVNRRPWHDLQHSIKTGDAAFDHHFGMEKFAYLDMKPDVATIYNAGMASNTSLIGTSIAEAYDFGSFGTIVDVGGGNGSLLVAILQRYARPSGIVLDLAHAAAAARSNLEAAGLADRSEFVAGSFFESVPSGADAYLMRWILHDWNDDLSVEILQTCRRAMAPGSKLLVIERLLPDGNALDLEAMIADINMLVQVGGRERTATEFSALLEAADLRLVSVLPTGTIFNVVEAVPA